MSGAICSGPRPQFRPSASTPRFCMVSAKISGVVPVRLVPCSKVMETMIGRSLSARMAATAMRTSARSNCVSMRNRSTPPSTRPRACSRRASYSSSGCRSPSGRTNCPHGPMSPATKASRPAASTAARAIRAIVRLNGVTSMPAGSLRREPPKVHVRMMSAPAAR